MIKMAEIVFGMKMARIDESCRQATAASVEKDEGCSRFSLALSLSVLRWKAKV